MEGGMTDAPLRERARGRWYSILTHIGIPSRALTGKHGPCPVCGGEDRFRFDDLDGRGTFFCNGCGAGDGIKLVERFLRADFKEAARRIEETVGESRARKTVASKDARNDKEA